jgi:hypothetical protein
MRGRLPQRQDGVALLLIALVLFTSSAAVFLSAVNNTNVDLTVANNAQREMVEAKQTLLAFAMAYAELFPDNPPGRFPCPDTNNDAQGLPDFPCYNSNVPGRLPRRINTESGTSFMFSDHGMANDQRFWFAVSPDYVQGSSAVLNSSTPGMLRLERQADIVAVLIAPGNLLNGKKGGNSSPANYLENANARGTNFVSNRAANPATFNDRVLPIYRHEVMTLVTAQVVQMVHVMLTNHRDQGNMLPVDQVLFLEVLAAAALPVWFADNQWDTVINYTLVNENRVTISFTGCEITYTVDFERLVIERDKASCEGHP